MSQLLQEIKTIRPRVNAIGFLQVIRTNATKHLSDVLFWLSDVLHTNNTFENNVGVRVARVVDHTGAVNQKHSTHESDVLPDFGLAGNGSNAAYLSNKQTNKHTHTPTHARPRTHTHTHHTHTTHTHTHMHAHTHTHTHNLCWVPLKTRLSLSLSLSVCLSDLLHTHTHACTHTHTHTHTQSLLGAIENKALSLCLCLSVCQTCFHPLFKNEFQPQE